MKNKVFASFDEAVADIPDGASIATGCWGLTSLCQNLIAAIKKKGAKDLTLIVHNFLPLPFFTEDFGNPSSSGHLFGWRAEAAVESARERLAAAIGYVVVKARDSVGLHLYADKIDASMGARNSHSAV